MEKQIQVCLGTDRMKCVRVRLSLLLVENGAVVNEWYHSLNIEPGADVDVARAAVEEHICKAGGGVPGAPWPAIPEAEWDQVKKVLAIIHTPEAVAAFIAEKQANTLQG